MFNNEQQAQLSITDLLNDSEIRQKLVAFTHKGLPESTYVEAEDILQSIYLNIWQQFLINPEVTINLSYIYRCIRNNLIDLYRRIQTQSENQEPPNHQPIRALEDDIIASEASNELHEAILELSSLHQSVILNTLQGKDYIEISQEMKINVNYTRVINSRAKKTLKKHLRE